jgi:hypothetical protein
MAGDFRDELPYPLSLKAENPQTYLELTKMREAAEAVHGKETIERVSVEYRRMRADLQKRRLDPSQKEEVLEQTRRLEQEYGYEVLAGAPRITGGDHPVHDWNAQLDDAPGDSA